MKRFKSPAQLSDLFPSMIPLPAFTAFLALPSLQTIIANFVMLQ